MESLTPVAIPSLNSTNRFNVGSGKGVRRSLGFHYSYFFFFLAAPADGSPICPVTLASTF